MNHYMLVSEKGKIIAEGKNIEMLKELSTNKSDKIVECTSLGNVEVEEDDILDGWADSDNDLIN